MRDDSNGILWFLVGAAVGASVALLYAPQSGKRTREYIGKKAEEGKEYVTETGRDVYDRGRELYEKGREVADEATELFERGRKLVHG